jgi:hypothetical protein
MVLQTGRFLPDMSEMEKKYFGKKGGRAGVELRTDPGDERQQSVEVVEGLGHRPTATDRSFVTDPGEPQRKEGGHAQRDEDA